MLMHARPRDNVVSKSIDNGRNFSVTLATIYCTIDRNKRASGQILDGVTFG